MLVDNWIKMVVTTVGLDLAKHVFQVHEVDALGVSWSPNRSGATSCWSFLLRCHVAWWGSRPLGRLRDPAEQDGLSGNSGCQ
jgi:hypothetical protein